MLQRLAHCPNSTEVPTRSWTPLPCIYWKCHQYWRVTRYPNYKKLSDGGRGKHSYKHRSGPMTWTHYCKYDRLQGREKAYPTGT